MWSGDGLLPIVMVMVSLSRTGIASAAQPINLEVFLIALDGGCNGDLGAVVTDTVDAIGALLTQACSIVVHSPGGRIRTPLILKA